MGPSTSMKLRIGVTLCFIALCFIALGGRLGYIQVVQAKELQDKAASQWTRNLTLTANRGEITDRNGTIFAQSSTAWTIVMTQREIIPKNAESNAEKLAGALGMDASDILRLMNDTSRKEHVLARQVSKEVADAVRAADVTGIYCAADASRKYPAGDLGSQVIGFTDVSGQGQSGIEARYDSFLKGTNGRIVTEITREQREIPGGVDAYIAPIHGNNISLTLDSNIQYFAAAAARKAREVTQAEKVWVGVMDVKTGEMLALVNEPSFDLNDPPRDDMDLLNRLTRNGFVADAYEPGSTFKIITTAAALEEGITNVNAGYNCTGSIMVDGDKIRCWRTGLPHGHQSLTEAVMNSCNPVFVQLALGLRRDTFYNYLDAFGFGTKTGIALQGESAGQIISIKYVKDVDLARIGFGQSVSVTPVQLLAASCAAVNGGNLMKPQILREVSAQDGTVLQGFEPEVVGQPISQETSAVMRGILEQVVSDGGGRNAYIPGYRVGGKTGTAQKYDDSGRIMQDTHTSSFIGFAPMDDPKIAVLFVVDEPGIRPDFGSTVAAPYAREILEQTLPYLGIQPRYAQGEKELLGVKVEVPSLTDMTASQAVETLSEAGLRVLLDGESGRTVVEQSPPAGTPVPAESIVVIYTDTTPEEEAAEMNVFVPDVKGMSIVEANRVMRHSGLIMRLEGRGIAAGQNPAAGAEVARGSSIYVKFESP